MADRSISVGSISGSVVVTGDGNAVSLSFGASGLVLPLDRKQIRVDDRRGRAPRELDILNPNRGTLPLIGRAGELVDLRSWLDEEADISVHTLIGRAGSGKTRLAIELCKEIDGGHKPGKDWVAGFLSVSDLERVAEVHATALFDWARSTLLVLDYAGGDHLSLGRWLDRLATQRLDVKLRILLLEREAPQGFGWWHELTGSALHGATDRQRLFRGGTPHPRDLPGLTKLEDRRVVVAAALKAVRDMHSDGAAVEIPAAGADPDYDEHLDQAQFANPLSLVMAGLIARQRGPRAALVLRRLDAARHLARRELDRFALLAGADQAPAIKHLVALNGLLGGAPLSALNNTLAAELDAVGLAGDVGRLAELLQQELPPSVTRQAGTSRLATIEPDLIGEGAIIEAFEIAPPAIRMAGTGTVRRAYAATRGAAAAALMRLLQDYAYALEDETATVEERQTATMAMGWLTELADSIDKLEDLEPLVFALPKQTLILREAALILTKRLTTAWLKIHEESCNLVAGIHASSWLGNLSNRLADVGQREAALAAAEQAVGLSRDLTETRPGAFTLLLAGSLNNLSVMLNDLGRREDALDAAEEAVQLWRSCTDSRIDKISSGLAAALNNLATMLGGVGRVEEALDAVQEAIQLYHGLNKKWSSAFSPDLALSVNTKATILSDLGQLDDALEAAVETVQRFRTLANIEPDAFKPNLAGALSNLAPMLDDLGRREEALTAAKEAVQLYRALADRRSDSFTPDLAMSLNNLALISNAAGQKHSAVVAIEESVRIRRALAEVRPGIFAVDLSMALGTLTDIQIANGDKGAALSTNTEAMQLLVPTFQQLPQAVAHWMVMHLQRYHHLCAELGQEPDMALIGPIVEVLQELQQGEDATDDQ